MKKAKKRKLIIIACIAVVLIVCAVVVVLLLIKNGNKTNSLDKYDTVGYENNLSDDLYMYGAGDFVYFYDYPVNYYGEYDTKNDKLVQLPINNMLADFNFYEGELYCVMADLANNKKLSIVKWDLNTGDYKPIYAVPDGVEGLFNFNMTQTGLMFFNERKPTSEVKIGEFLENEEGFRVTDVLYMYNPETKEKTKLAEGAETYYIRGNRIYFNRVHKTLQEVVYYIDIENPEKVVDTGVVCRTFDGVNRHYSGFFYVDQKGEYIYYSGGTNEYKRRNINTGEEEILFTYTNSRGYVAKVREFNGKHLLYVRCVVDNVGGMAAKIYELDVESKENKLIWEDTLEELLGDFGSFKGNNEFFVISTYPSSSVNEYAEDLNVGNHYYIVYEDGTKKLIFDDIDLPRWAGF